MKAPIRLALLVALSVAAIAPAQAGQQIKQVGFWKKKNSAIHNTNPGNVGIGTTSPAAKLDVAGAVAVNGSNVIDGAGQWVGDPTGLVGPAGPTGPPGVVSFGTANTRGGTDALLNNTTGSNNTAFGVNALYSNTTGARNTASGAYALDSNTTGFRNTANGFEALCSNTIGSCNTACGHATLANNTTGYKNTACGFRVLWSNTTGFGNTASGHEALSNNSTGTYNTGSGFYALLRNTTGHRNAAFGPGALYYNMTGSYNTASGCGALALNSSGDRNSAIGDQALQFNSTGSRNIALGNRAGRDLTTGNDNIDIGNEGVAAESATIRIGTSGTHTRSFVAGIRGVTTDVADAVTVMIDSSGQLGTVSSSRRFKEDIHDMGDATDKLLELRPVVFRYKPEVQEGERPIEYGLIAEEVAEIFPDLVVYDDEGLPFTVKYHILSSMLLNELKKLRVDHDSLKTEKDAEMAELRKDMEALREHTAAFLAAAPSSS